MTADRALRIGVVLEAFLDWPLDQVLPWLREHAPEVTDLEIGAGGYAPHPRCDVAALLASDQARSAWRAGIARHGLRIGALNAWGNPLHPDPELARQHDRALRDAIRLAALLGVSRVVALAGCPPGAPALDGSRARVISIEHEDPFVPAAVGVPEAARLLQAAIDGALEPV